MLDWYSYLVALLLVYLLLYDFVSFAFGLGSLGFVMFVGLVCDLLVSNCFVLYLLV